MGKAAHDVTEPRDEARHLAHVAPVLRIELSDCALFLAARQTHVHDDEDRKNGERQQSRPLLVVVLC